MLEEWNTDSMEYWKNGLTIYPIIPSFQYSNYQRSGARFRAMASISLCMIVRNEEKNLPLSLRPVVPYFDEVIVVDTGSTDDTVSLAKRFLLRTESIH